MAKLWTTKIQATNIALVIVYSSSNKGINSFSYRLIVSLEQVATFSFVLV